MASITDGAIKKAISRAGRTGKQEALTDGEGRGTGRLVLIVRPMPSRVTADWYAQQWRDGKRSKSKLGSYPAMSLAEAREVFRRDYTAVIEKGSSIKVAGDMRAGTVRDLFDSYIGHLEAQEKRSVRQVRAVLTYAQDILGPNRKARDITPDDVLAAIRPVFERGKIAMADRHRCYIRSAFSWGIKSERDYRMTRPRRFSIESNPADGIPTEPVVAGTRWLRDEEWVTLWRWTFSPVRQRHDATINAIRLVMLTGQRIVEIASLRAEQFNREERSLEWRKTKNGRPHAIPLPDLAFELLDSITPNEHGLFFPKKMDPSEPVTSVSISDLLLQERAHGAAIPGFTMRDLRRTWKTLAGKAGMDREIRDRMQNHTLRDVASKHYDRYDMMKEKRAAMAMWDGFVRQMIARHGGAAALV